MKKNFEELKNLREMMLKFFWKDGICDKKLRRCNVVKRHTERMRIDYKLGEYS
jgi:hypothetical protein